MPRLEKPPLMVSQSSDEPVISVKDLSRQFGTKLALDGVNLSLHRGTVLGLIGENGAGKTTLIKHLLGTLKPQKGTVRLFGLDPVADPVGVLSKVGYLSERRDLPGWMRVEEFLRYVQAFYPGWDDDYADQMLEQFQLEAPQPISTLSQGQQAKLGLLTALAYNPELLILDEPSSGLDPVVRHEILEAAIRTAAGVGRSVLFSSHLLDEVERVASYLVMLQKGRVVLRGGMGEVTNGHIFATLRFSEAQTVAPSLSSGYSVSGNGSEWKFLFNGSRVELENAARQISAQVIEEKVPTLDEILIARASKKLN